MRTQLLIGILFCCTAAIADTLNANIVHVARRLAMTDAETRPPKQFFLDKGTVEGVEIGQVFEVMRWQAVVSRLTGEPVDYQKVRLGAVQVVSVGPHSALAQGVELVPEQFLNLDYPIMMVGDSVELRP